MEAKKEEELSEEVKAQYANEMALFVQKTGVSIEDAQAFVARIAMITMDYIMREEDL